MLFFVEKEEEKEEVKRKRVSHLSCYNLNITNKFTNMY
jgi:hypothetical protein